MTKKGARKGPRPSGQSLSEAAHDQTQMLTTAKCARWMGVNSAYIVAEIQEGYLIANNVGRMGHRHDYRIYFNYFVAYLRARRWSKIPIDARELT